MSVFSLLIYSDIKNKNTLTFAKNLGIALQLTNIIRDLGEDARRGRIYIPLDELKKLGVSEEEIISLKNSDKIKNISSKSSR